MDKVECPHPAPPPPPPSFRPGERQPRLFGKGAEPEPVPRREPSDPLAQPAGDPGELVAVGLHGVGLVEQEVDVHVALGLLGNEPDLVPVPWLQLDAQPRRWVFKECSVSIPSYAGMKTGS